MAVESPRVVNSLGEPVVPPATSDEVTAARMQVLSTDQIVQVNLEAAEAIEKGEVYYGGTK